MDEGSSEREFTNAWIWYGATFYSYSFHKSLNRNLQPHCDLLFLVLMHCPGKALVSAEELHNYPSESKVDYLQNDAVLCRSLNLTRILIGQSKILFGGWGGGEGSVAILAGLWKWKTCKIQ